ncbi:hypothetical protein [Actinomadura miaoliensis]|uniref:hypothetical protein n=1 Tax=Actinomadura miaoliensis TaxID=430685 RepID=UPI0031EA0358
MSEIRLGLGGQQVRPLLWRLVGLARVGLGRALKGEAGGGGVVAQCPQHFPDGLPVGAGEVAPGRESRRQVAVSGVERVEPGEGGQPFGRESAVGGQGSHASTVLLRNLGIEHRLGDRVESRDVHATGDGAAERLAGLLNLSGRVTFPAVFLDE